MIGPLITMTLRALGTKLILRPEPHHTMSDGGIHLLGDPDDSNTKVYYVVSAGPKVSIEGLKWGCRVLANGHTGQGITWEGHPLRIMDQEEILMVLP